MNIFILKRHEFYKLLLGILVSSVVIGCVADSSESTEQYIDNSVLTAKVKSKLLTNESIKSLPITVNSYKGTVQLSGFVESQRQEKLAVNLAQSVPGVVEVQDHLSLMK